MLNEELTWRRASDHQTYPPVEAGRARARARQLATQVTRPDLRYLARQIGSLDPRQTALQRAASDLFSTRRPDTLEQLFTRTFQEWKNARWV